MRKDCALSRLTEEQQADLFDWLTTDTYDVVLERIAQPSPKGFGIKTHTNSLFRFYQQRQAQIRAHDLNLLGRQGEMAREGEAPDKSPIHNSQNSQTTQSSVLTPKSSPNPAQSSLLRPQAFFTAASAAFAHSTYILAHSPLNPATYRAVSRTLHQHEDNVLKREYLEIGRQQLALARERLQFDRTQFEYNASRAALALLPELAAIDQLNNIDDEAKIWRARDRLFGPSSTPQMPNEKCSMINAQSNSPSPFPPVQPQSESESPTPSVTNDLK